MKHQYTSDAAVAADLIDAVPSDAVAHGSVTHILQIWIAETPAEEEELKAEMERDGDLYPLPDEADELKADAASFLA